VGVEESQGILRIEHAQLDDLTIGAVLSASSGDQHFAGWMWRHPAGQIIS
jgi:hypothetical protein